MKKKKIRVVPEYYLKNISPYDLNTFFGLLPGKTPAFPGLQRTPIIMTIKKKRTEYT